MVFEDEIGLIGKDKIMGVKHFFICKIFQVIFLGIFLLVQNGMNAQENSSKEKSNRDHKKDSDKFFIRVAAGAQGGFGVFFPTDLNNYTKDFWNALIDQYYPSHNYPGSDKVIPIVIGFDYNLKAVLRIINIFQLEGYWENYYAIGLQIQSSLYQYGYGTQTMQLDAKYQFIPTYQAWGGNFLLTPGARRRSAFFTIGGGMAKYTGSLKYHDEGTSIVNGVKTTFDNTTIYTGTTFGYTATLGVTYVPWKYLELESFITGRLAKIQEIKDENGIILKNPYRNNEVVSLDFSGIDLRLGVKFIIP